MMMVMMVRHEKRPPKKAISPRSTVMMLPFRNPTRKSMNYVRSVTPVIVFS